MAAFNKITLIILAFALIAMYFKETNVQIMLLFFAYLSHYPNSDIFIDENNDDYTNLQT